MRLMIHHTIPLLLALTLVMGTGGSWAQNARDALRQTSPEERAEWQTDFMKEALSLTEAQQAQVHAIHLKYAKEMQPLLESNTRKLKKFRQVRKLNKRKDAELKIALMQAQYHNYQDQKKAMRAKIKERRQ